MRLGVDVGGTFTDVVLDAHGELTSTKVLTTHEAPERAILEGVGSVTTRARVDLAAVETIIHGTTLATNALIERSGAHAALVTTAGFRDVIETRTESRFEQYDLQIVLPTPLIERRHRHVVRERMAADGTVLLDFDDDGAHDLIDRLAAEGYDAVAVGFLHSYRNPAHEHRFRDLLHRRLPDLAVSLSAEVSPQMREYERFNTVCANAYVQPLMSSYLHRLRDALHAAGATCPVHLIHSGGGLMTLESAARFPVRLVESGPAGGAIFAADLAARHGLDRVLSYDMGGTTAKISLIEDHTPRTAKTFEVARTSRFTKGSGMPISIPVIEMIEIGAGGGSIATVDLLGQIRVGPESAGSEPGPAAYGRGGTEATVTDADVALGRLSAATFGADGIDLSPERAGVALEQGVGAALGLGADDAAVGIAEVVDENMANAARVHAVESGKDISGFTMVAFGGAAPLHAAHLCEKLGIDELVVPPGAGVGSAIGFLRAPFAYEAVRSHYSTLTDFDGPSIDAVLDELTDEAVTFVREGSDADPAVERWVSMRYAGQGWEIPVEVPAGPFATSGPEQLGLRFEKSYEEFFGRPIDGLAMEAVSWAVRAAAPTAPVQPLERVAARSEVTATATRTVYDTTVRRTVHAAEIPRDPLRPGDRIAGPAVVVEAQTSTIVATGHEAVVQDDGCLLIRRDGATR